ncbi:MAG: class I SAM-dependent methyltransferase [Oscillospiraceae bacterium]
MLESKAWNWESLSEGELEPWREPCFEAHYLAYHWAKQGKKRLLDLGCGLGRHSVFFARLGFQVSAFDLSDYAVERTRRWAESEGLKLDYSTGDMLKLPYEAESFDCILCRDVISHTDTEGVQTILGGIFRALKPGGECWFTLESQSSWGFKQDWPMLDPNTKVCMEEGPEKGVQHFYADDELIKKLCSDFDMVALRHVDDIITAGTAGGWHYYVHVRKPNLGEEEQI